MVNFKRKREKAQGAADRERSRDDGANGPTDVVVDAGTEKARALLLSLFEKKPWLKPTE